MPNWTAYRKDGPTYRFLAIRELLEQAELPGLEAQLPFPSMAFGEKRYKLFGLVANRDIAGDELIFGFINLAGRVVRGARQLAIRLSQSHPAYQLLLEVRRRLRALWDTGKPVHLAAKPP